MSQRIGIYGGSFNPPHLGHLQAAKIAIKELKLDKLIMIPIGNPPYRTLSENDPKPEERYQMLEMTVKKEKKIELSDLEIREGGCQYTYQSIEKIKSENPKAEIFFLVGTDMFLTIQNWVKAEEIFKNAVIAVFPRNSQTVEAVKEHKEYLEDQCQASVRILAGEPVVISSTEIREKFRTEEMDKYLNKNVVSYIHQKQFYKALPWTLEELRSEVEKRVDKKRFIHILGVEKTAAELASQYHEDIMNARAAGILHDVTKTLRGSDQLKLCSKYGIILDTIEMRNYKLLHAKTGAAVAKNEFHASDEICLAIRWHTTGHADMTKLEKIIYLADYIEPGRKFDGVEQLRALAKEDLDKAVYEGLKQSLQYVEGSSSKDDVSHDTQEAINWYEKNIFHN